MYVLAFPHDPETPDEYKSNNPIWCTVCGYEFDVDEDLGDSIKCYNGSYTCLRCITENKKREEDE